MPVSVAIHTPLSVRLPALTSQPPLVGRAVRVHRAERDVGSVLDAQVMCESFRFMTEAELTEKFKKEHLVSDLIGRKTRVGHWRYHPEFPGVHECIQYWVLDLGIRFLPLSLAMCFFALDIDVDPLQLGTRSHGVRMARAVLHIHVPNSMVLDPLGAESRVCHQRFSTTPHSLRLQCSRTR